MSSGTEPIQSGSMGLAGIWKTVGNASAMVCVCVAFFMMLFALDHAAREDRALCREQLGQVRQDFAEFRQENKEQQIAIRKALSGLRKEVEKP